MASIDTSSTAVETSNSRAQAEARAAVLASLQSAGSSYDVHFQRRARDIHENSAAIAQQEAGVQAQTKALSAASFKFDKEVAKATKSLKDIGDVQNWAEMLERDMLVLEETLRLAEGRPEVESASDGSQWR